MKGNTFLVVPWYLVNSNGLFSMLFFTGRNEVVAKVIFLHLSVILFTGGVCLSACWDATPPEPGRPPQTRQTPPRTRQTPPPRTDQADPPQDQADTPPPKQTLADYERPVRILLECILVLKCVF